MIEEDLKVMTDNLREEAIRQHGIDYVSTTLDVIGDDTQARVHVGKIGRPGVIQAHGKTVREAFDEAVRRALRDRDLQEKESAA